MYDAGIFRSEKFSIPVICIGNLVVGGAGKSPMAEYLIRLLKDKFRLAVLSRGYGRKTKGFRTVRTDDSAANTGDEPLQFKRKFEDITVAVAEKRVEGINQLKGHHDVIILDDAFQHRAVQAGLTILLFDYHRLNDFLFMLPAGNLREPFSNRKRANILVISKCPEHLSAIERVEITKRVKPRLNQSLFFSYLDYGNLISLNTKEKKPLSDITNDTAIFLLTGIANPQPLLNKLEGYSKLITHHDYPDHHNFSTGNITKLAEEFNSCKSAKKSIITTEKDAQRLQSAALMELLKDLSVYYLPISAKIHEPDEARFNTLIENYVAEHIQHNNIHQK
jgi:tetraacyldisaccharide 4'-kinase